MNEAKEDVLAYSYGEDFIYRHIHQQHSKKVWSINQLERVNEEIQTQSSPLSKASRREGVESHQGSWHLPKRRGDYPPGGGGADGAAEQQEHWQLEGHRMFSAESMTTIPEYRISRPCSAHSPERCNTQAPSAATLSAARGLVLKPLGSTDHSR
jgi:hypothetical protein